MMSAFKLLGIERGQITGLNDKQTKPSEIAAPETELQPQQKDEPPAQKPGFNRNTSWDTFIRFEWPWVC
jgi:hypothetical protein